MSVALEEARIRRLLERVEAVEDVANSMDANDARRAKLLEVSESALADEGAIRPVIAARLLGLSERTVRTWAEVGVLPVVSENPRFMLDLVDNVAHRLSDGLFSQDDTLRASLEQMRRGEVRVLRPKRSHEIDHG